MQQSEVTTQKPEDVDAPACHLWPPPEPGVHYRTWQAERCAVCGRTRANGERYLVDHCHKTGLERGVLCSSCNTREGVQYGELWTLYRARPPSAICLSIDAYYSYVSMKPAEPLPWVVEELGAVPEDPAARAAYLAAAAPLVEKVHDRFKNNVTRGMFDRDSRDWALKRPRSPLVRITTIIQSYETGYRAVARVDSEQYGAEWYDGKAVADEEEAKRQAVELEILVREDLARRGIQDEGAAGFAVTGLERAAMERLLKQPRRKSALADDAKLVAAALKRFCP